MCVGVREAVRGCEAVRGLRGKAGADTSSCYSSGLAAAPLKLFISVWDGLQ